MQPLQYPLESRWADASAPPSGTCVCVRELVLVAAKRL
jgi:hypothetical protein